MPQTVTGVQKLKINRLTKTQFDGASPSNTEIYAVDPEFSGDKLLATDSNGDIIETTIDPAGVGTVTDVQVNGTTVVTSGVANIPKATTSALGVVQPTPNWGIGIDSQGRLMTSSALDSEITGKSQSYKPLVPTKIDLVVKTGMTTNTLTLTDSEKTTARDWIGAGDGNKTIIREWVG